MYFCLSYSFFSPNALHISKHLEEEKNQCVCVTVRSVKEKQTQVEERWRGTKEES